MQEHGDIGHATLLALELLTGLMAIYGSISMLVDAIGFGLKEEWLRGSPFTNYQVPAIGLLLGVGGSSFLAAGTLLGSRRVWGIAISIVAGAILIIFEMAKIYHRYLLWRLRTGRMNLP